MSFNYKPPKKKKSKIFNAIKVASDYLSKAPYLVTPFPIGKKAISTGVLKYKKYKEKDNLQKLINTLKSEIKSKEKLSKGSHPGIETQHKRKSKEKHPLEKRKPKTPVFGWMKTNKG
tara:strand:- start:332 stop:682 length:351 start_codon:yes stop_codon:yes gene_type:complete